MNRIITTSILLTLAACSLDHSDSKYLRWVGDSVSNVAIDTLGFQICSSEYFVKQYFHFDKGLQYKGEKKKLVALFKDKYIPVDIDQSGWIRIRFIVNCKGETGRFRIIESDLNYQERNFDQRITNQLLNITQSLDGWEIQTKNNKPKDYYQYLIFKIINGDLIEIMP